QPGAPLMNLRTWLLFFVSLVVLLPLVAPQSSYALPTSVVDLRLVALSGKTAPGTGGEIFAPTLGLGGQINNQGQVFFGAAITQPSGVRSGMWLESSPGQA